MTNLTNQPPQQIYADLLTTTNNGQGFSNTLQYVEDGIGNNSPMQIALDAVNFIRGMNTFQLDGIALTASTDNINDMTNDNPIAPGTGSLTLPIGTTAERPNVPVNGMIRYNSQTSAVEAYVGGFWIAGNGNGSVTSVTGTANQIDVVNPTTTPSLSLSNTIQCPGTFTCSNIGIGTSGNNIITSTNLNGDITVQPGGNGNIIIHTTGSGNISLTADSAIRNISLNTSSGSLVLSGGGSLKYSASVAELTISSVFSSKLILSDVSNTAVVRIIKNLISSSYDITLPTDPPSSSSNMNIISTPTSANAVLSFSDPSSYCFQRQITQTAHGFIVGNVLYFGTGGGGQFTLSQASGEDSQNRTIGIVVSVIDADTFVIQFGGYITLSGASLVAGSLYYLSPTVLGGYTDTKPSTSGQYVKPLFIADSGTTGYFINQLGVVVP